jgi:hypothetical protein
VLDEDLRLRGSVFGVDADEESRRRQREELMYWNAVHMQKLGFEMCLYAFLFSDLLTLLFNKEGVAVVLPGLSNRNFIKAFLEYPFSQASRPRGLQAISSFRYSEVCNRKETIVSTIIRRAAPKARKYWLLQAVLVA